MHRLRYFALFVLGFVVHIRSLAYKFVAVDTPKLIVSSRIRGVGDAVEVLTQPLMHRAAFTEIALFYRPLSSLSFSFDYLVWGLDPFGYHLTNLLLQGSVLVLVAIAVTEMTGDSVVGQLSAVLFALHPLTAEVVPAAARRHDIIMAIFMLGALTLFIRSRSERGSHRLLVGALISYALALGAKEPAIVIPGLVFAWTVIQQFDTGSRSALWSAVRAVLPFGVVTIAYLAVRVAVLGGLGGYHGSAPVLFGDVIGITVEYVVSIVYPSDVIGNGISAGGLWWGALLVLVAISVLSIVSGGLSLRSNRTGASSLFAGFIGGCIVILLVVLFPSLGRDILDSIVPLQSSPHYSYMYPRESHISIGVCLVGTCLIGGLWVLLSRPTPIRRTEWTAPIFFGIWLLAPLVLFFQVGHYNIRSGYVSIIPAMAILSLVVVSASRRIRSTENPPFDRTTALIGIVLLLVVPMIATSPLFHTYDGWKAAGEMNQLVFDEFDTELNATDDMTVTVHGLPNGIAETDESFPQVESIVYLGSKTVQSWLRLRHPKRDSSSEITIHGGESTRLQRVPERISITTTRTNGTTTARLHYQNNESSGATHESSYPGPPRSFPSRVVNTSNQTSSSIRATMSHWRSTRLLCADRWTVGQPSSGFS